MASEDVCECGKPASWFYGPGHADKSNADYCDECVPRGCFCNWTPAIGENAEEPKGIEGEDWAWVVRPATLVDEAIESGHYWQSLDKGKPWPCCEFMAIGGGIAAAQDMGDGLIL